MSGSKRFKKKISNELFNKIVGHARDPIQTEMEITRRNELCRLINERNNKNSELYRLEREEKRKMENEIENKYERLRKENSKEYDAKIAELEQMVNACLMSA
jgi:CO dehydrogenase/acetyl-CoA synthase beta subunit